MEISLKKIAQQILEQEDDYYGEHKAPVKGEGYAPMHDLSGVYPDDFYTMGRKYVTDEPWSRESLSIVQSAKNRPNKPIKIYRAVPDFNREIDNQIKTLNQALWYYRKWGWFKIGDNVVKKYENIVTSKHGELDSQGDYQIIPKRIEQEMVSEIERLESQKTKSVKIEPNNWVTISKSYAVEHGKDNLGGKYKIVTKTVPAKNLYTDGNDINEWGYVL